LRGEHRANLFFRALRVLTAESVALHTALLVTLRGPWAGEIGVQATVVAVLADGIALALEGDPDEILARLLTRPAEDAAAAEDEPPKKSQNTWDRVRRFLTDGEDSPRGEGGPNRARPSSSGQRLEGAALDPAKSSAHRGRSGTACEVVFPHLSDRVIMKTDQWMANLDVRLALIHNAKTPQAFSLRILPMLPDSEIRTIARAGTTTALKQAAT